jgi:Family of unknown function (DUF5947)
MTTRTGPGGRRIEPLAALRRVTSTRPPPVVGERCEMCAEPLGQSHSHVVNLESRALLCTCRGCYLLFTAEGAELRYRAVPERYLSFPDFTLGPGQWDELDIPVGLAFLFRNSVQQRTIAFYPGPAGATESELPLEPWATVMAANPRLGLLEPDVEALLVRAAGSHFTCHLVPIDACYELVGRLRQVWRGFDGGQQAHQATDEFFAMVSARSRPAPAVGSGSRR